ncbi:hypothetical protein AB0P17_20955 [Streptomyces sp. NPDC088124]|uniref:hypothetical protein n=1 Tax=Streptomyces sp. NPDC088124 TaxID=3154654 RepID=UPI00343CF3EA
MGTSGGRWGTRTWFSRAARDGDSWAAQPAGDASEPLPGVASDPGAAPGTTRGPAVPAGRPARLPGRLPGRSRAYAVLASVGRRCPALSLSAADCAELEPLAAEWFVRGAGEEDVLRALTGGLPVPVHHPAGLVRSRLVAKLPPELAAEPVEDTPPAVAECSSCRAPVRPGALRDGECGVCRGEAAPVRSTGVLPPERVRTRVAEVRAAALGRAVT